MDKDELEEDQEEEEETATPEEMKAEAVERMKLLKIYPETIKQFENEGLVSISEPPLYAHYWAADEIKQVISDYEKKHNLLIYYGVLTIYKELGHLYSLFFVSNDKNEWILDRDDMEGKQQCVYVYNKDNPDFSDPGPIGYEFTRAGSLRRTW